MSSPQPPASLVSVTAGIVLFALSIYLLIVGQAIFVPLFMSILIAYLVVAMAKTLRRLHFGERRLPATASLACAILLLVGAIAIMVQLIADNVRIVVDAAPAYQTRLETLLNEIDGVLAASFNKGKAVTVTTLLDQIDLRAIIARVAGGFQALAGNTVQIITYVGLKTAVSLLTSIMTYVVLVLIGVDFAAFWGLVMFILNFIPYVGSAVGVVCPSLLALLQFDSVPAALIVLATMGGVLFFVGNVVEPRLTGKSLNLSPMVILLGLSVWSAMWGVVGMILSVPIMVMAMIVLSQFPRTRPLAILMSESGEVTS